MYVQTDPAGAVRCDPACEATSLCVTVGEDGEYMCVDRKCRSVDCKHSFVHNYHTCGYCNEIA